jgi:hypothetical protein
LISSISTVLATERIDVMEALLDVLPDVLAVAGMVIGVTDPSPHDASGFGIETKSAEDGCRMYDEGILAPFGVLVPLLGVLAPSLGVLNPPDGRLLPPSGCFSLE